MSLPLSILDFAMVFESETPQDSFRRSVQLAQHAEEHGFHRVWYAEHHNMPSIASAAPAVLIAHVGAHTKTIRLGAGGVMLPNHSPYVVAEQFGTLAHLYPNRIDLGVGRAPGTDQHTLGRALRRSPQAAETFPQDVQELQAFLSDSSPISGVVATPGQDTQVPLYVLGSSLFGAQLAAQLGLPYSFASHFAPQLLDQALRVYREQFQPSAVLDQPYVIAAVNVTAADTLPQAHQDFEEVTRNSVRALGARGRNLSEEQLDALVYSPAGQQIAGMLKYTAIGTQPEVQQYLQAFADRTAADELMISLRSPSWDATLRAVEIVGKTELVGPVSTTRPNRP